MKFGSPEWQRKFNPKYKGKKRVMSRRAKRSSKTRSVYMARKGSRRSGTRGLLGGSNDVINMAIGGAIVAFAAQKMPIARNPLVQGAAGLFLANKGGMIGGVGKAAAAFAGAGLASGALGTNTNPTSDAVFG